MKPAELKARIYVVVFISTDDCNFYAANYCDTFNSEKAAQDYINTRCRDDDLDLLLTDKKEDYEIRSVVIENLELIDEEE